MRGREIDRRLAHRAGDGGAPQQQRDERFGILFAAVAADAQEGQVRGGKAHGESLPVCREAYALTGRMANGAISGDPSRTALDDGSHVAQ